MCAVMKFVRSQCVLLKLIVDCVVRRRKKKYVKFYVETGRNLMDGLTRKNKKLTTLLV